MSDETNHVAAMCAVCGRYVAIRAGVSVASSGSNRFAHPECAGHDAPVVPAKTAAVLRPSQRHGAEIGFMDRLSAASRPRLAAIGGVGALVIGLALIAFAGGDDRSPVSVRPGPNQRASTEVLGATETTSTTTPSSSTSSTVAADGTATTEVEVEVSGGVTVTTRRGVFGLPVVGIPGNGDDNPGSPDTGPPATTVPGSPSTTRPPTGTAPPTTAPRTTTPPTTVPPTTVPPTTAPPATTVPPTTAPPTTVPPTTAPPATTVPPTTAPPTTTEPPTEGVGSLLDGVLDLLRP